MPEITSVDRMCMCVGWIGAFGIRLPPPYSEGSKLPMRWHEDEFIPSAVAKLHTESQFGVPSPSIAAHL
ncbi:hypothetical protein CEXT_247121 [Caerostris extrusa]|uniref:Uncharacterized protein n=1 Tax=Caerostris extrusa TaxID=172846 RepID=A0AAV4XG16_CAEEX|nr:hypothetical protein CEXT_247121 [Caerostris extrusa]